MKPIKAALRWGFSNLESVFDRVFTQAWNPLYWLGGLGFFYFWIVTVSGFYVYAFFDTGVTEAYDSVHDLTHGQWYLGGVMRSLHRYASDALVVMMVLHMLREFAFDRYRGTRFFSWITGVPMTWLVIGAGGDGLLAGLGRARPVCRHRLFRMVGLPAHLRRAHRAELPGRRTVSTTAFSR